MKQYKCLKCGWSINTDKCEVVECQECQSENIQQINIKEDLTVEDETKGIVSGDEEEEQQEMASSLMVEHAGPGKVAVFRDYSRENAETSKLKRLVR